MAVWCYFIIGKTGIIVHLRYCILRWYDNCTWPVRLFSLPLMHRVFKLKVSLLYLFHKVSMHLGSLSCWNTKLCHGFNHLAEGRRFFMIFIYLVQCSSFTGSKTALDHDATTIISLYRWSLWPKIVYLLSRLKLFSIRLAIRSKF